MISLNKKLVYLFYDYIKFHIWIICNIHRQVYLTLENNINDNIYLHDIGIRINIHCDPSLNHLNFNMASYRVTYRHQTNQ